MRYREKRNDDVDRRKEGKIEIARTSAETNFLLIITTIIKITNYGFISFGRR